MDLQLTLGCRGSSRTAEGCSGGPTRRTTVTPMKCETTKPANSIATKNQNITTHRAYLKHLNMHSFIFASCRQKKLTTLTIYSSSSSHIHHHHYHLFVIIIDSSHRTKFFCKICNIQHLIEPLLTIYSILTTSQIVRYASYNYFLHSKYQINSTYLTICLIKTEKCLKGGCRFHIFTTYLTIYLTVYLTTYLTICLTI